ncbi:MAG: OadG family protein [Lachnospiraceae bacterium]|nr:OadG family protein [Lachnospiraceae bacterium]
MKKISILLCFVICLLGLSACSPETPVDPNTAATLESMAASIIEGALAPLDADQATQLTDMGAEYLEYVFENAMGMQVNGNGMVSGFTSWQKGIAEIGAYKEITGYSVKYNTKGDGFIVDANIACENGTAVLELTVKDDLNRTVESAAFNVDRTFGQKMKTAALNTLLGMGTVFIILIIIMAVISCFNYIPKIQAMFKKETQTPAPAPVLETAPSEVSENLAGDEELVAVISAAIAAYEGSGASGISGGYVVRSIRRRR